MEDFIKKETVITTIDKPLMHVSGTFGGEEIWSSVCKIAINFFIHNGGKSEYIKDLIPYLKLEKDLDCIQMIMPEEPVHNIDVEKEEVSHLIHIEGNKENKILYAFIEFFNAVRYIVLLNSEYTGENINETYCYDVLTKKEKNKDYNIYLSYDDIRKYKYINAKYDLGKMTRDFDRIRYIGDIRYFINFINKNSDEVSVLNAYKSLISIYFHKKNYDNSIKYCLDALNRFKDENNLKYTLFASYVNKGINYNDVNDFSCAIENFTATLDIKLNIDEKILMWIKYFRGWACFYKMMYKEAIEDLTECIKLDTDNIEIYQMLGEAYFHIEDYDNTYKFFSKVIELDANNANAYFFRTYIVKDMIKYHNSIFTKKKETIKIINNSIDDINKAIFLDKENNQFKKIKYDLELIASNINDLYSSIEE